MLDDNIVDNNEDRYIPIRARGNAIIGYLPLSQLRFYYSTILMLNLKSFLAFYVTI